MGRSAVARFLLHLQLTFKKTLHAAEQERPDVKPFDEEDLLHPVHEVAALRRKW